MEARTFRRRASLALAALSALCIVFLAAAVFFPRPVTVTVRENRKAGAAPRTVRVFSATAGKTVGQVLDEAGVETKGCEVEPAADESAAGVSGIEVSRRVSLGVRVDGEARTVETAAATVGEALDEAGIGAGEDDRVVPEKGAPVADDTPEVRVDHAMTTEETKTVSIPREVFFVPSSELGPGETRTEEEGADGVMEVTEEVKSVAGEETGRKTVGESTIQEPEPKVVSVGEEGSSAGAEAPAPSSSKAGPVEYGVDGIALATKRADGSIDTTTDSSYARLVNSAHGLPASYEPDDLVSLEWGNTTMRKDAAEAYFKMRDAMKAETGIFLKPLSGYRSYATQKGISGSPTTAGAGYSEHQTGLACDFGTDECEDFSVQGFGSSKAYQWLCRNAHNYGFELTMPENTYYGVGWEPWHWRFVGKDLAPRIRKAQDEGTVIQYDDFCDKFL